MITAIIADDENPARERLRELLDRFALFDIVAEAKDGNEALHLILFINRKWCFLILHAGNVGISIDSVPAKSAAIIFRQHIPNSPPTPLRSTPWIIFQADTV